MWRGICDSAARSECCHTGSRPAVSGWAIMELPHSQRMFPHLGRGSLQLLEESRCRFAAEPALFGYLLNLRLRTVFRSIGGVGGAQWTRTLTAPKFVTRIASAGQGARPMQIFSACPTTIR